MKIAFLTSEAVPFSKTGGLADVCGSLPPALAALGAELGLKPMAVIRSLVRKDRIAKEKK